MTYIDFAQHRKRDAIVQLAKLLDLIIAARVLAAKLIAGKPDDLEFVAVLRLEVFVELLETRELGRETAFGGGVDDEHDFAG